MLTDKHLSLFSEILSSDDICILTHKTPDGDALGTSFALLRVLKNLNKNAQVICSDKVPPKYRFLTDGREDLLLTFTPKIIVTVDIAAETLIGGKYSDFSDKIDYAIDHHFSNSFYAKNTILDDKASSSGELLFNLLKKSNIQIDDYIAEKLYSAISFDTGCFRFSNSTSETHLVAAELLKYKFDAAKINVRLFDTASLSQLRVENEVVRSVRQFKNNKITMATIRYDQIKDLGIDEAEVDGLTTITRRVEGTIVGITVREKSNGEIKISLRSQQEAPLPEFDVSKVASVFGGGGHVRAAGLIMRCSVDEAEKRILDAVCEEWDRLYDNSGE